MYAYSWRKSSQDFKVGGRSIKDVDAEEVERIVIKEACKPGPFCKEDEKTKNSIDHKLKDSSKLLHYPQSHFSQNRI